MTRSKPQTRPLSKKNSFIRRITNECFSFFERLRTNDDSDDSVFEQLFDDESSEEYITKITRPSRGFSLAEEEFVEQFKKYKSLDKLVEMTSATAGDDDVYSSVSVAKMRTEFLKDSVSSDGTAIESEANIGTKLWEYRRSKWLEPTPSGASRKSAPPLSGSHDQCVKIYNQLVDKGRHLKSGLNLQDVVKVINAGWIAEDKWDRAAKGLP